ncbi:phosphoribosylanthranilate isomerase [Parerythrobacter lacustris]|uniref:N-(5'-phosphoribosyl)anthranilate isomerase n=1 Tax=Parerythrobacter lacustris TaxID=2969984 RepID=A0ABT1XVW6_9SPHN|nr:phosphoribosylanthranilate isomerase [Parerythrobacter lacustris]MCR2834572.1 phosphoribosylanthranilate isomerase [Parerythrobacter lacustris]
MQAEIKICGLSTEESVEAAIAAGATHIGLVHFPPSPRHVDLATAGRLRALARGRVKVALLSVNAEVEAMSRMLEAVMPDVVQLHGSETPEWAALLRDKMPVEVWKALGVKDAATLEKSRRYEGAVDRLLFDAPAAALPGGNGEAFDWRLLAEFDHTIPWGLAGGLTADNVGAAIAATGAKLVDTSSGVERAPGVKDAAKIAAFCAAAHSA